MKSVLLNSAEAAEALRVGIATIHRWRQCGEGPPYIKLGNKVYYRPSDLDAWIEEHKQIPQRKRKS